MGVDLMTCGESDVSARDIAVGSHELDVVSARSQGHLLGMAIELATGSTIAPIDPDPGSLRPHIEVDDGGRLSGHHNNRALGTREAGSRINSPGRT